MQARTILVWSLTPLILLTGLWLETKDRPADPVRAIVQGPRPSSAPDLEVAAEPTVEALAPPEYQDYWEYEKFWDQKGDELTKAQFEDWERTQAGTKVRIVGTVTDVEARSYWDGCMTGIRGPKRAYAAQFLDCDEARNFNKGDPITLNCILGDDGIISPDVEECEIQ